MYHKTRYTEQQIENAVDELLSKMTLKEKIGQLHQVGPSPVGAFDIPDEDLKKMIATGQITQEEYELSKTKKVLDRNFQNVKDGNIGSYLALSDPDRINKMQKIAAEQSRLHIPLLIGCDVIHGFNTVFPIPLAESCSFDDELFFDTARVAAKEARAAGINWTFTPMLDISRDARWGRIAESMGQDTYLACRYAKQKVDGLQNGDLADSGSIAACAKHYLAYGACEGGKDYNSVDMSYEKLFDVYLAPFESAVNAGVASVMASFNDINGVPVAANRFMLTDVLKDRLGFGGVVVSDAGEIWQNVTHGYSKDDITAGRDALHAGVDIDMTSSIYTRYLEGLIAKGEISEDELDESVKRVLRLKFALGLFDNPYSDAERLKELSCSKEHLDLAKKAALHSTVLLKNNGILPIDKSKYKNIYLIGALAGKVRECFGCWTLYGKDEYVTTLSAALEKENVKYLPCYDVNGEIDDEQLNEVLHNADLIISVLGENIDMSGEAHSYADISLSQTQKDVVEILSQSNIPFVGVLMNGRPMCVSDLDAAADAVIEAWQLGTKMGDALADILFGRFNPCGKLTSDFPYKSGECPAFYNHLSTGRAARDNDTPWTAKYDDGNVNPLYCFGHGLSYTTFEYSNLAIEKHDDYADISVKIKNTGKYDGYEVAQLYIHDMFASRVRPVRELKGYKKVFIKSGEETTVTIKLPFDELKFYNQKLEKVLESGDFEIFVGTDSAAKLKGMLTI